MNRGLLMIFLVVDLLGLGTSAVLIGSSVKKHWISAGQAPIQLMPSQSVKVQPPLIQNPVPPPAIQEPAAAPPQEIKEEAEEPKPESKTPQKEFPAKKVTFKYTDAVPKRVAIVGDFNNWSPQLMKKDKLNNWTLSAALKPGNYAYNFIVDGKMIRDPANRRTKKSGQKILSSLLVIKTK